MKRQITLILCTLLACLALDGCNMWRGLGKDVQKIGTKMETGGK